MATWDTHNVKVDGQTDWLVRMYETSILGIRKYGLPSEVSEILTVDVPTLGEQAKVMRYRASLPPGHNVPSGILD